MSSDDRSVVCEKIGQPGIGFKIQIAVGPGGWSDMKGTDGRSERFTELYASREEAAAEMAEMILSPDDDGMFRVVSADVKEDCDVYA